MENINSIISKYSYINLSMEDKISFIANIVNFFKDKKIVILGAGVTGKFYYKFFQKYGLKISYFTDKNADIIKTIEDVPVYKLESLKKETENIIAIIAGNPTLVPTIHKEVESLELKVNIEIVNGDKLISIAQCASCIDSIEHNQGIAYSDCSLCYNEESECSAFKMQLEIRTGKLIGKYSNKPRFGLMGYILGQNCTLNCLHCCEGIPFIEDKKMSDTDQVIKDIQKLSLSSEYIGRIEFIGGEPFLHKGLPEIIDEVLKLENIGYIVVFTNGTVVPKDGLLQALKHSRVVVNFSSYDETSLHVKAGMADKVKTLLERNGINLSVYNPYSRSWMDFNSFEPRTATEEQFIDYLDKCFISYCHRVFNGIFYGCPHYYTGIQLQKVPKFDNEYIDLHSISNSDLSKRLIDFQNLKSRESCRYCTLPYDAQTVKPAIQLERK